VVKRAKIEPDYADDVIVGDNYIKRIDYFKKQTKKIEKKTLFMNFGYMIILLM